MEDDYDHDEGAFLDFDDGWIYVEDEYGLAVSSRRPQLDQLRHQQLHLHE